MRASDYLSDHEQRYAASSPSLAMHYGTNVRQLTHEEAQVALLDAVRDTDERVCAVCGSTEHMTKGQPRCGPCRAAKRKRVMRCIVCGDPYTATTRTRFCPSCQPRTGHEYALLNVRLRP